jgi:serine/threonine-protein kinase
MSNPSSTARALALAGAALAFVACAADSTPDSPDAVSGNSSETGNKTGGQLAASKSSSDSLFTAPEPWTKVVAELPKSDSSDAVIGWLSDHGGWGGSALRIDFGLAVLHTTPSTPFRDFTPTDEFYSPDCDHVPFPVPANGALEEEEGYSCTTDGDCHLVVVDAPSHKLYEMWRADMSGGDFRGGCAVVWDLNRSYAGGRGQNCTSADAGGFPIAAMAFTADEVAHGSIDHAIRFVLPNARIRRGVYVAPATHASDVLHGGADAPPYGVRFRLRADYPIDKLPTEGARVVARAMQRYGMILADGGKVPLTAVNDRFTEHKWDEVGVDVNSLTDIDVRDMEVVDMGTPVRATGDCERE